MGGGQRANRLRRWPRLANYGRALSNPGVRLGYALCLAGVCFAALAICLGGPVGSVAVIAPAGLFALSAFHHFLTAQAFEKRK